MTKITSINNLPKEPYTQQLQGTFDAFTVLFNSVKIGRVVEFGTGFGGLTNFLGEMGEIPILTFDIDPKRIAVEFNDFVQFQPLDVFDPNVLRYIRRIIQSPGRTLVLCDGGNKIKEMELYGPLLKHQDIIMAHDYPTEINPEDVKVEKLKPLQQEMWTEFRWLCYEMDFYG